MKTSALILCITLALLNSACRSRINKPFGQYNMSTVEAVPACQFGGAPYRHLRNAPSRQGAER